MKHWCITRQLRSLLRLSPSGLSSPFKASTSLKKTRARGSVLDGHICFSGTGRISWINPSRARCRCMVNIPMSYFTFFDVMFLKVRHDKGGPSSSADVMQHGIQYTYGRELLNNLNLKLCVSWTRTEILLPNVTCDKCTINGLPASIILLPYVFSIWIDRS